MFSQTNKKLVIFIYFLYPNKILKFLLSFYFILALLENIKLSRSVVCVAKIKMRRSATGYASSPLNSRHGSQESLRHLSSMSSMNMLQTPTGTRDVGGAQKKKGIKSSLGRFFSKKEKVIQ